VAGVTLAREDGEVLLVELLSGLPKGMERDERILEFGRGLALDGLAIAVYAVDVVTADILLGIVARRRGHGAAVDLLADLTGPRRVIGIVLVIDALVAHVTAFWLVIEFAAVIALRNLVALVSLLPCPARLRDGNTVDDAGDRIAVGADLCALRHALRIILQRRAAIDLVSRNDRRRVIDPEPVLPGRLRNDRIGSGEDRVALNAGLNRALHHMQRVVPEVLVAATCGGRAILGHCPTIGGSPDRLAGAGGDLVGHTVGIDVRPLVRHVVVVQRAVFDRDVQRRGACAINLIKLGAVVAGRLVIADIAATGGKGRATACLAAHLLTLKVGVRVRLDLGGAPGRVEDLLGIELRPRIVAISRDDEGLVGARLRAGIGHQLVGIVKIAALGQVGPLIARHLVAHGFAGHQCVISPHVRREALAILLRLLNGALGEHRSGAGEGDREDQGKGETPHLSWPCSDCAAPPKPHRRRGHDRRRRTRARN